MLPQIYDERLRNDAKGMWEGVQIPQPEHVAIRNYILQTTREVKAAADDEVRQKWKTLENESNKISDELQERTNEIRRSLPEGVRKMWGDAHLGLLGRMITEADPQFGTNLASFILQGVPTVGEFPRTNLFNDSCKHRQNKIKKSYKLKSY